MNSDAARRAELRQLALKRKRRRQLSRGMYVLPSLFTSGNIAAGFFAITQIFEAIAAKTTNEVPQHLDWAALAICLAIPFDSLDGRIARLTKTTTEFGKELDSLADVITFGVAPSLLAFVWGFRMLPDSSNPDYHQHLLQAGVFVCFLFLFAARRDWRGSTSAMTRFRGTRASRTGNILWACRFRQRRECWRLRCIFSAATRCRICGWRRYGWCL